MQEEWLPLKYIRAVPARAREISGKGETGGPLPEILAGLQPHELHVARVHFFSAKLRPHE